MADFVSNSAILTAIRPQLRAYAGDRTRPKVRKMADFTAKSATILRNLSSPDSRSRLDKYDLDRERGKTALQAHDVCD